MGEEYFLSLDDKGRQVGESSESSGGGGYSFNFYDKPPNQEEEEDVEKKNKIEPPVKIQLSKTENKKENINNLSYNKKDIVIKQKKNFQRINIKA